MEAVGAVEAQNASTSSLESAQNAFPTATTGNIASELFPPRTGVLERMTANYCPTAACSSSP